MVNTKEIFEYDKQFINTTTKLIASIDEVGRGPLAGPVVCCSVIMNYENIVEGVFDSKKLTAKKR
ncbi:MAG: ribonuclease HII, partial [Clostridia bacterium]|nr:ribonuclease HII [Clostridia bacterium]